MSDETAKKSNIIDVEPCEDSEETSEKTTTKIKNFVVKNKVKILVGGALAIAAGVLGVIALNADDDDDELATEADDVIDVEPVVE